jgi:hypothetical protein
MGPKLMTNKKLTRYLHDQEPFAGLENDKKSGTIEPTYQYWGLIYIIVQIYRPSLRTRNGTWRAYARSRLGWMTPLRGSKFLKWEHFLRIRKDALSLIVNAGPELDLPRNPPRTIKRLYALLITAIWITTTATRSRSKPCSTHSGGSPTQTRTARS